MVQLILPIIICFIPVFICFFTFKHFQIKISHLFIAILLGLITIFPISFIQFLIPSQDTVAINPVVYSLLKSLIVYGLIEEAFKSLFLSPLPCKKNSSPLQFLLLSFMFGLTLGAFESVVYFLDKLQLAYNRGGNILYVNIFARLFSSDIIHMTCAGLSGLFVYTISTKKTKFQFFIYAILLHGLYDFFAAFQNGLKFFAIPVILLSIMECRIKYKSLCDDEV